MNYTKGFGLVGILISIGIIGILAVGSFYMISSGERKSVIDINRDALKRAEQLQKAVDERNRQVEEALENETEQSMETPNTVLWQTYRNDEYGFEFKYPGDFVVGKYEPEVVPNAEETRKIFEQGGYNSKEIDEKLSPFKNDIVLVEKSIANYFNNLQAIPVGKGFGITIKPNTGKNGKFLLEIAIRQFEEKDRQELKINSFTITRLPGYPGPYGDSVFYYVLKANDKLVIEFSGFKKYPKDSEFQKSETDTNYNQVIEKIISTFKLTQ